MTDSVTLRHLSLEVGPRTLLEDVGLELHSGKVTALVGPSGCGKTLTARCLLGLVDLDPGIVQGELTIRAGGRTFTPYLGRLGPASRARERAFAPIRGTLIGYLAQDARASLDPLLRCGRQVADCARLSGNASPDALPSLRRAGLADAERVARLYPHELSGGMAQRVAIACALARGSRFLLCDEPTTALDPTVQAGLLAELRRLAKQGIGLLFITHDLSLVPGLCDEVLVMDHGHVVERSTPDDLAEGRLASDAAQRLVDATKRVSGGRIT